MKPGITKHATLLTFSHSYATHLLTDQTEMLIQRGTMTLIERPRRAMARAMGEGE